MVSIDNLESIDTETLLYLARVAEQSERYDDMISFVKQFVNQADKELSVEERNILSVAYKNVVGSRRASWRVLSALEHKEERKGNSSNKESAALYKQEVESELESLCKEVLFLLEEKLIPKASSVEARVFYQKMKGDYFRYMCEFVSGGKRDENAQAAQKSYEEAMKMAEEEMNTTDPIRLGLVLNFSVFHYEITGNRNAARQMSQKAFDEAIKDLDNVSEETYKDSTLIMQLLRDNLQLWNSDEDE